MRNVTELIDDNGTMIVSLQGAVLAELVKALTVCVFQTTVMRNDHLDRFMRKTGLKWRGSDTNKSLFMVLGIATSSRNLPAFITNIFIALACSVKAACETSSRRLC